MIEFASLPPGPIQNAFNIVRNYLTRLRSVPLEIVPDVDALKIGEGWQGRQVIVRDLGGVVGTATYLDGTWYDKDGGAL